MTSTARDLARRHPIVLAIVAALSAVALVLTVAFVTVALRGAPGDAGGANGQGSSEQPSPRPTAESTACDDPTVRVSSARELTDALDSAQPGDVIALAAGTYQGNFHTSVAATADQPIALCGTRDSVLDGGDIEHGYVLHLDGASNWLLSGFSVRNGQKGVMADGVEGSVLTGLSVSHIGDEAIHLRAHSTDNQVVGNEISDTGLRKPKFGEGVYIGSAESNWCDVSDCKPDQSDNNLIEGNSISNTTAESVDIKEGTTGGILRHNTFDGAAMVEGDSWVDVKGNDWIIENNVGTDSPMDGFQTHEILDGWGTRNIFRGNTAEVNGPGLGFSLTPVRDNVVECDNTVSGADEGMSNVSCSAA